MRRDTPKCLVMIDGPGIYGEMMMYAPGSLTAGNALLTFQTSGATAVSDKTYITINGVEYSASVSLVRDAGKRAFDRIQYVSLGRRGSVKYADFTDAAMKKFRKALMKFADEFAATNEGREFLLLGEAVCSWNLWEMAKAKVAELAAEGEKAQRAALKAAKDVEPYLGLLEDQEEEDADL